jgi:uncharacterized protein YggE
MDIMNRILFIAALIFSVGACQAGESLRTVTTSGQGLVSVSADMAQLNMQLEALNRDSAIAKADVDNRVNQFLKALQNQGIAKNDIIAPSLRLNLNYQYQNQKRQFTDYRASRPIRVTLKDLNQLNLLMDSALKAGIDQIGAIELQVADKRLYQDQARQRAITDSKEKAEVLAKAYNAKLGSILRIEYQAASNYPQPYGHMEALSKSSMGDQVQVQYLHDQVQFTDRINVVFELLIND